MNDLYTDLVGLGCQIDHNESDLYVKETPESFRLIKASGRSFYRFRSNLDGAVWFDVPFAYLPWWRARERN